MKKIVLFAVALLAVTFAGMSDASAQDMKYSHIAFTKQTESVQINGVDGLQKYYKEDHDCDYDHDEYGDYHDDPRYDRGEFDDDCFED